MGKLRMMHVIYLDNAATTQLHEEVAAAMEPYLGGPPGNASSIHGFGRRARSAIDDARSHLAALLGCEAGELVFTSGGTESVHAALFGAFLAAGGKGHIVTSQIEHHAVLHTCDFLESLGAQVTRVGADAAGRVDVDELLAAIRPDTCLVSLMAVNNELGTVQPIEALCRAVKERYPHVLIHSDMVQALGTLPLALDASGVDLASFSAHKIHGPQGVGLLYLRKGVHWTPVLRGGAQERERRAGTENVAGIVGFGAAAKRLAKTWADRQQHLAKLNEAFWTQIRELPNAVRNSPDDAVPAILNISFLGIANDTLLMRLDLEGVAASAGAACSAGSLEPSHVLLSCGLPEERVTSAVRFSFSDLTTLEEVDAAAVIVRSVVSDLLERRSG
jgi:cysteine desulfurase